MTSRPHSETESDIPDWVNGPPAPRPAELEEAVDAAHDRFHDAEFADDEVGDLEGIAEPYAFRSRRPAWVRKAVISVGVALVAGLLLLVVGVVWVNSHLSGAGGAPVTLTIADQAGHGTVASELGAAHVVSDTWLFRRYLDYRGTPPAVGGTYTFHLHEGYRAALHDLGKGPVISQTKLTIPEGYDIKQIAQAVGRMPNLSADRFLTLATSGAVHSPYQPAGSTNLEGLLFPDTYFVGPHDDEQVLLQRMVDRFAQIADASGLSTSAQTNGLTPYQTVVLASLIEKEARVDVDRPKIARVIINRLQKGMKLQIDATVEYAEGVHKTRLLNSDLATKSPYNTYLIAGLPPAPIAGPGRASIVAALNPTPGTWLYYVLSDPNGTHAFATTPAEFDRLKAAAHARGLL